MTQLVTRHPQEAQLLAIDFEETAAWQRQQRAEQEAQLEAQRRESRVRGGGAGAAGHFEADATIGDDDEVDWHAADLLEAAEASEDEAEAAGMEMEGTE